MKKINRWQLKYQSHSIFKQLVVAILFISVVPILVGSIWFGRKILLLTENVENSSYSQVVSQYMKNTNEKFTRYRFSLEQISKNTIIIDTLIGNTKEHNPYLKGEIISTEITKTLPMEEESGLYNCIIYSNVENVPIFGRRVSTIECAKKEGWYVNNDLTNTKQLSYLTANKNHQILSLIEPIIYVDPYNIRSQKIGYIKLDINASKLFAPVNQQKNKLYQVIILDKSNQLLYTSSKQYRDIYLNMPLSQLSQEQGYVYDDVMVYKGETDAYGYKILLLFSANQFKKQTYEVIFSSIIISTIILVAVILISFNFSKRFSLRIEKLVEKIKFAETGDLSVTEPIEGRDEIAELDAKFSQMLTKLNLLIENNYIQQLHNKETELQNLQLQINPHFLYNTLETISSMAAIQGAFNICDVCEKLGEIFRYSLGKNYGNYVTVEQELYHIENYIFIQKVRFDKELNVEYRIENDILQAYIPRFILQPIIENAMTHGLKGSTSIKVLEINSFQENDRLCIEIKDNGVGMTPDKVEGLQQYINTGEINDTSKTMGIGIRNVNQRIRISCGKEYGITIYSKQNYGSCFKIELPLTFLKKDNASGK